MTPFWYGIGLTWLLVAVVAARGAFVAAFFPRNARRGDPMRLATFLVALLFVGYSGRWIWFSGSLTLWKALGVISVLTGVYVIALMHSYGRGDRIHV